MDADIEHVYRERGIEGVRPRFAMPLIRLAHVGPLTIKELAAALGKTHSAMSQTIGLMRREGLVTTTPGADARTRPITLTERGRALVPFLEAEWRATEQAVAELDAEVPYPLTRVVAELEQALLARPFLDRLRALLDTTPSPGSTRSATAGNPGPTSARHAGPPGKPTA
ncbi:MarR family winged helix-turn-helix transcriptional regulator [Occultella kanbiaonis]|uniref:MarR family winged helix-turn-helix transcriptional regulator n=1 Tax=Occultella kanbiaonis TaxID=2675754 RepID=UPI0013D7B99D|nr:MarR family winged helix-turn-helix transcriptional regulator [Occultella kanbiaonis]